MEHFDIELEPAEEPSAPGLVITLVIALVLLIVAFVWFVIRLDPLTSDFIGTDNPVATATPAADEF